MKQLTSYLFLLVSSFFLYSCSADQEFTSWPCRFVYDNSISLDQTLATATNPDITGIFCKITEAHIKECRFNGYQIQNGIRYPLVYAK